MEQFAGRCRVNRAVADFGAARRVWDSPLPRELARLGIAHGAYCAGDTFLIPWYIIFSRIWPQGSYWPLILSHMVVGLPFIAWVMIPFFENLPAELEEAARIDGATPFGAFFRIAVPLAVPGMITAAIMSFIFSWNNFMFLLVLAGDQTGRCRLLSSTSSRIPAWTGAG